MLDTVLFRDVTIVSSAGMRTGDVFVENGKIAEVEPHCHRDAELVIHETGLHLFPGVIDPHVHFRDPGAEWKEDLESGSRAAAAGGVTTFFDMPNTKPATTTIDRMVEKKALASQKSIVNYNFFIGATDANLDDLVAVENVPGIKIYVGSSTGSLLVDQMRDLERIFAETKHLIAVHSEDEVTIKRNLERYSGSSDVLDHLNIRSPDAAIICTRKLVKLAEAHKHPLHICHLTTAEEALFLSGHPSRKWVTTEVSPQHLLLSAPGVYEAIGTYAQINPPIREKRHADALWTALKNNEIQLVATDHAPHTREEKDQAFPKAPSGMPGIETSFPLMLTLASHGDCSYEEVVKWMSEQPASVFGVKGKGHISVGMDADLVLVDLKGTAVIENDKLFTKCKWSAFSGQTTVGRPIATFVHGQLVFREGEVFSDIKGKEADIKPRT
ncbi:MAG: dihydroorotase [Candidatus Marinamargulisbacteria bacterium]|jgi:dihydroorotase